MIARRWLVGVDVGGTFTDVALAHVDGQLHVCKTPTTPDNPRAGVVAGIEQALATAGVAASEVARVVHGTTLATNVILERTGPAVAFVVTEGFADVLRLGREARVEEDRYDLFFTTPEPVTDPALTFLQAREVRFAADRPFTAYADGDPLVELPATIRVVPRALRVLAP